MEVTKAALFSVLRTHHADDQPALAQRLPDRFDTEDYPGLLDSLGIAESDLVPAATAKAEELSSLAGDPHGRRHANWPAGWPERRRSELRDELMPQHDPEQ